MLAALDRPEGRTTESMTQAVLDGLRLNVGVVALQQRLVRHGYLTGMISNHALPFFEEIIRRHCLLEFFDDESLVVASYMDSGKTSHGGLINFGLCDCLRIDAFGGWLFVFVCKE